MNRRGFLGAMLAACAAPAIVRADSLMRIVLPDICVVMQQYSCLYGFTDKTYELHEDKFSGFINREQRRAEAKRQRRIK